MTPLQEKQIDNLIDKLNCQFDYELVPINLEKFSREKQCYSNVEEKVKRDGGMIHYGWSVHFTDNIIIEAERHAVWENDNEDLICITPHPSNLSHVIFLSDNKSVDENEQIDNVRMNITNNSLVNDWIHLSETIGDIYNRFTTRLNDDQVNMEVPVHKVLTKIDGYRGLVMGLIKSKKGEKSKCFCEKGVYHEKKYIHCHRKILFNEIPELLQEIASFERH
ncbi:MAG: hypothetical protein WBA61_16020 [Aequorivita sp.]